MDLVTFEANIPQQIRDLRRWIGWAPDAATKRAKCPVYISRKTVHASTRKPESWSEFSTARLFWQKYGQPKADGTPSDMGIGFVFTEGDELVYIDLDDAVEGGVLREWAMPFVTPFLNKAYIELSPSGRGLHIIARGVLPIEGCGGTLKLPQHASEWAKEKGRTPELALFMAGKFTTVTGDVIDSGRGFGPDCSEALAKIWDANGFRSTGIDRKVGPPPSPETLAKLDPRKLSKAIRDELKNCTVADAGDQSSARFSLYVTCAKREMSPEEIYALVLANEDWYHASGAHAKGEEHTWQDICRAHAKAETASKEFKEATVASVEQNEKAFISWKDLALPVITRDTKDGPVHEVVRGVHACVQVLTNHPDWRGRLRYNEFTLNIELDGVPLGEVASPVAEFIRKICGWEVEPHLELVRQAMLETAHIASYNPVAEWLRTLVWDGTERLDDWLVQAGCEDCEATRLTGRKWMIGLVARATRPGCKMDSVLVLEGLQGAKKSTLFRALAGDSLFTDSPAGLDRDGLMVMHRYWIVELAELATFKRAQSEAIKHFVSSQEDTFRPPYGRSTRAFPRHFVVVGSTNEDAWQEDSTGGRRYLPVRVLEGSQLHPEWVAEVREQLLAEAVAVLEAGEPWWWEVVPQAITEAQAERYVGDPLESKVRTWVAANPGLEFQMGVLMSALGLPEDSMSVMKRLGPILRQLGYRKYERKGPNREHIRIWGVKAPMCVNVDNVIKFPNSQEKLEKPVAPCDPQEATGDQTGDDPTT